MAAEAKKLLGKVRWATEAYDVMKGADCLVIITEWNEFRALDLDRIRDLMNHAVIIACHNGFNDSQGDV